MFTGMKKRPYTLKKRAESREATRARIVAATVALHEELGPKDTTISAVAERAGVQRLTVYRHFPDETALFKACTSQWLADHPPPDAALWEGIGDGEPRVRAALATFYLYYRATTRMWTASYRDMNEVPALRQPMKKFHAYLDGLAADLAATLQPPRARRRPVLLTMRHALRFETWHSLASQDVDDDAIVELMMGWLSGVR